MTEELIDILIWQMIIGLITLYYIQYRFNLLEKRLENVNGVVLEDDT